jgi:hypothetical protein
VLAAALLALTALASGCGDEDQSGSGSNEPELTEFPGAAEFVDTVDNPFMPWVPGAVYTYEGKGETIVVEVTDETKEILGVQTTVVHDTVSEDGQVTEDTFDWYAQDEDGNVWYFGEDSKEMKDGEITSTHGSWEAGVDGAKPGIVMEADPQVGDFYYQEYYKGVAEDTGEVMALDEQVEVPYGSFDGVLRTEDINPLEPDVVEHKSYAPGVGVVLEEGVKNSDALVQLVSVEQPG